MLRVYGRANSINVRKVLWMLGELNLPYEREDWGRGFRPTDDPVFRAINPVGVVPVIDDDGLVLLCLHSWQEHDHPSLMDPEPAAGNGLLLFFRVDDFEGSLQAARRLVPKLEEEPSRNPSTGTMEFALRDPDGYYVMVSALEA